MPQARPNEHHFVASCRVLSVVGGARRVSRFGHHNEREEHPTPLVRWSHSPTAQSFTFNGVSESNAGPSLTAHFSPRSQTVILPFLHSQSTLPRRVESPFALMVMSSHSFGMPAPMMSVGSLPDSSRDASMSSWSSSISAAVQ